MIDPDKPVNPEDRQIDGGHGYRRISRVRQSFESLSDDDLERLIHHAVPDLNSLVIQGDRFKTVDREELTELKIDLARFNALLPNPLPL